MRMVIFIIERRGVCCAITLLNNDGMTLAVLKYIVSSQSGWM
jgi:hypothetical protein